jgi:hypothetical protein
MRAGLLVVCTLILASCGGGGGGGGNAPQPAFTLNPPTVTATLFAGTSATLTVTATATAQLTGTIYATIIDRGGVLLPQVTFTPAGGIQSYHVGLTTSASLKTGHYTGTFQVNVCYDANCAQSVAGSPVSVPYDFTVTDPPAGSNDPPPSAPLTFNPSTVNATFTAGDPAPFLINVPANSPIQLPSTLTLIANDPDGRILSKATLGPASVGSFSSFTLTLQADSSLQPGLYNGAFQLNVCLDQSCAQPVAGSPVTVPYTIQVMPKPANAGLTPLTAWSGVSDWETFQHDAGHTGFVPVTLNTDVFATRWLWTAPGSATQTAIYADAPKATPVTVSGGQVYVNSNWVTYALKEFDSTIVWQHDFKGIKAFPSQGLPNPAALNPPAASGGKVYVSTSAQEGTFMFALSAADGSVVFQTPFLAQFEHYLAPTVDGGVVFGDGGYYGGMVAFDANAGTPLFAATTLPQFDMWTPAVDANYAYAYLGYKSSTVPAGLYMLDRDTGAAAGYIPDANFLASGLSMNGAPVLGQSGSVFAVNLTNPPGASLGLPHANALLNFDTTAQALRWQVAGKFQGNPAYATQVLYAVNSSPLRLEAHAETDGSLLWSWAPQLNTEIGFIGDVLVTNNLVLVSTNVATYAISQSTHQVVWSTQNPGWLALSASGVLYIVLADGNGNPNGQVLAINVKN